jgi:hypothetical protein
MPATTDKTRRKLAIAYGLLLLVATAAIGWYWHWLLMNVYTFMTCCQRCQFTPGVRPDYSGVISSFLPFLFTMSVLAGFLTILALFAEQYSSDSADQN